MIDSYSKTKIPIQRRTQCLLVENESNVAKTLRDHVQKRENKGITDIKMKKQSKPLANNQKQTANQQHVRSKVQANSY